MNAVPEGRIRKANDAPVRPAGEFVLYWMTASRRTRHNFGLQRAVESARELRRPLVVLEGLRCDYPWASDRIHRFVIDGMTENAERLRRAGAAYVPLVEGRPREGARLMRKLVVRACTIVTDDSPAFFLPRMIEAAARKFPVRLEAVDSCGLLPLDHTERVFPSAFAFRRNVQQVFREHLSAFPASNPLSGARLPSAKRLRLPATKLETDLSKLPIDHAVAPFGTGGPGAGAKLLRRFIRDRLRRYGRDRNHPDRDAASGLSPYLHFGHVSSWEVFDAVRRAENWSEDRLAERAGGRREGWWGMTPDAEAFLDQLVVWRELGFNMARHRPGYDTYENLPAWSRRTLEKHAKDPRPSVYSPAAFEAAETHDPVWNAAQRQLVAEGRIHNYLRMLWGKKILEWSRSPREAFDIMIELNNKYALDGRDPNSYSGILWVLGLYDRPWGPERPIFGTVRYMSSESTVRKLHLSNYLETYGGAASP